MRVAQQRRRLLDEAADGTGPPIVSLTKCGEVSGISDVCFYDKVWDQKGIEDPPHGEDHKTEPTEQGRNQSSHEPKRNDAQTNPDQSLRVHTEIEAMRANPTEEEPQSVGNQRRLQICLKRQSVCLTCYGRPGRQNVP